MKKILIFLGILVVILAGYLVLRGTMIKKAVDPTDLFAAAKNTQRLNDVTEIKKAVTEYYKDKGALPLKEELPNCSVGSVYIGSQFVDLGSIFVDIYLAKLPMDPDGGTQQNTLYKICYISDSTVEVTAPKTTVKK